MKISVLMSTYNGEQYICEQLDSIKNQTRTADEVVIIDDCSADQTVNVVQEYITENQLSPIWQIQKNTENKGWRQNFMDGITKTSGDIVFFSDQDDFWMSNKLEVYENIFSHDSQVNVIASPEVLWDGEGFKKEIQIGDEDYRILRLVYDPQLYLIQCSGCAMAFRRAYYDRIRRYYVKKWAHDDFFWKMSVTDGSMAMMKMPSVFHRMTGNNESRKKRDLESTEQFLQTDIDICRALYTRIKEDSSVHERKKLSEILRHKYRGFQIRKKSFDRKDPMLSLKLAVCYSDIYRRKRQIAGDVLLYLGLIRNHKRDSK